MENDYSRRSVLLDVQRRLQDVDLLTVELTGRGRGEFLFVRSPYGAVEVSVDEDASLWVEYWGVEDSDGSRAEASFLDADDAFDSVSTWLSGEQ